MIEIEHLTKLYGDFVAVDDISLSVSAGEIYGFLGPNGAGKTTTIRILAGLSLPTSGFVRVAGVDVGRTGRGPRPSLDMSPTAPTSTRS